MSAYDRYGDRNSSRKKGKEEPASNARIVQKNLVYVIGLPEEISTEEVAEI